MKILVVGGGIMGLGLAREYAGLGHEVRLLEKNGRLGDEASRAAAGMIGPQSEALEDDAYFAATLASRDLWPAFARDLEAETGLALGFREQGALHLAFGAAYERRLEAKYLWQKRRAGNLERLEGEVLRERFPYLASRVSAAFLAHGDYWIDNEALVDALEGACLKRGVQIEKGVAASLQREGERLRSISGREADLYVLAAGAWGGELFPELAGQHPVKGQMLSFKVPPQLLPEIPIHAEFIYLVPRGRERLLAGATVETVGFDKRMTGEGIEWLLQNAFETIPDLRSCEVDRFWSGLRPGSGDGWPTLGASSIQNLSLALGHYRRGILFLPFTVHALREEVLTDAFPKPRKPLDLGDMPKVAMPFLDFPKGELNGTLWEPYRLAKEKVERYPEDPQEEGCQLKMIRYDEVAKQLELYSGPLKLPSRCPRFSERACPRMAPMGHEPSHESCNYWDYSGMLEAAPGIELYPEWQRFDCHKFYPLFQLHLVAYELGKRLGASWRLILEGADPKQVKSYAALSSDPQAFEAA